MYNWLLYAYPKGWATIDQCKIAVNLNKLSEVEYESIVGEKYVA